MRLTGVGTILSASHRDEQGEVHGHSWEITAWHSYSSGLDAVALQKQLRDICSAFDHTILPRGLARAEDFAQMLLAGLGATCVEVVVTRPLERLYAKARRAEW